MHRVERETNNELNSSLFGSDRPSGLCNLLKPSRQKSGFTEWSIFEYQHCSDILCRVGVMFAIKESDLRSAKKFPSQQKSSESAK